MDVIALHRPGTAAPVDPVIPAVDAQVVPVGPELGLRGWLGAWLRSGRPRRVLGVDWSPARAELARVATADPYDLVWFSHVDTWVGLGGHVAARHAVVDFDNLENIALRLRRRVPPRFAPGASLPARARVVARWLVSRAFDLVDERRWDRLQKECAAAVDRVVVCSELDVTRSGCANAVVVGNGAERPTAVATDRRTLRGSEPTMLFVGALDYEPNTEAMEWFVREVLPEVRRAVPEAVVRIVGRGAELIDWTREVAGVEVVGAVAHIEPELERADVSIVPIRVGAGTRLKVIEALANRLPLVTTTVGCEGIALVDGVHALVRDTAGTFAQACATLLRDGELRQELTVNGAGLFAAHYDWEMIEQEIAQLATVVTAAQA